MKSRSLLPALTALVVAASCTEKNAEFCCDGLEDCARFGIDEPKRGCADGLACVANQCVVASCATMGCAASAPVCDIQTDHCVGCADESDCARFDALNACDTETGACVACLVSADCGVAAPVCDDHACRPCSLDAECASGACADDGRCVAEDQVVYLHPLGQDAPPCSRAEPCKELQFGLQQTTSTRNHVVFAQGNYTYPLAVTVGASTSATSISIHGNGSVLTGTTDDGLLLVELPTTLRDLELESAVGTTLRVRSRAVVERVQLRTTSSFGSALHTLGATTLRDVTMQSNRCGITLDGGSLTIDRATIRGGTSGICAQQPGVVDLSNLLVSGTSEIGIDLSGSSGTAAFVTIVDTGTTGTGVAGLKCHSTLALRSSIIWTPDALSRPAFEGNCAVASSIIGPTGVVGSMNVDPLFVNRAAGNYHLSGGSPARDLVDTGPTMDFERDSRPRGARFDIGADEAP
ncbi:MAG: hypothetical protein ACTHU0_14740 [Kofleriaceae bacterium]